MKTILLLDLENTIIWDWIENDTLMCARFPILKEWVCSHLGPNTQVGLLSWAIWNQHDLDEFSRRGIRNDIEVTHGFKFNDDLIFTRDNMLNRFKEWKKLPFLDADDFMTFFKKQEISIELWQRLFNQPDTEVIVFDDTLQDMVLTNSNVENNTLRLVNPWTLIKRDFI